MEQAVKNLVLPAGGEGPDSPPSTAVGAAAVRPVPNSTVLDGDAASRADENDGARSPVPGPKGWGSITGQFNLIQRNIVASVADQDSNGIVASSRDLGILEVKRRLCKHSS